MRTFVTHRYILVMAFVLLLFTSTSLFINAQPSPAPRVWSITPQTQTHPSTVTFVVTFSEPVTGVDITDFSTSGDDQSATVVQVLPGDSTTTYYVDVALTGPTTGVLLVLIDNDSITNTPGIPLGNLGWYNGNATSTAVVIESAPARTDATHTNLSPTSLQPRAGGLDVGKFNDIVLTSSDIPIISYYDTTNGDLKLAICDTRACISPTIKTIDSTYDVGKYASIAITDTDRPVISYYDATNGNLKLAICNNTVCSTPTIRIVDSIGDVGSHASLALTSNNVPVISYYDGTNRDLKLAICDDINCINPTLQLIDEYWDVGNYTSIAITSTDIPIISYFYDSYGDLKMAICNTLICDDPEIKVMDNSANDVGMNTAIALANDDTPYIVYYDANARKLKMAYCYDSSCLGTTNEVIADNVYAYQNAIATSPSGKAFIAYGQYIAAETSWTLQLLSCYGIPPCALPVKTIVDLDRGITGFYQSIAVDSNGVPVVSYYNNGDNELSLYLGKSFIDQGQPNSFDKLTPTTNTTINTSTLSLTWQPALNATSYEYCYATSIDTCTAWTSTTNTNANLVSLTHNTTYYWQVRALNAAGTRIADSNTYRQFTVFLPPGAFNKSKPNNNATNVSINPTLSWQASVYATTYEYCISTSSTCTNWKSVGINRTVALKNRNRNTIYYWQVRAKNAAGTVIATDAVRKFTTQR
jgi:hypothetical protein